MITQILNTIGKFSPLYLFFISLLLLRNYNIYQKFYAVGTIINFVINITLKAIIRQPRPDEHYKPILTGTAQGYWFAPDIYGMPSGHAQNCAFNLAFITAVFKSSTITCLYLIVSIVTLGQRYIYNYHTILQLLVGFSLGLALGRFCYYEANKYIKGHINFKEDDNGPL